MHGRQPQNDNLLVYSPIVATIKILFKYNYPGSHTKTTIDCKTLLL